MKKKIVRVIINIEHFNTKSVLVNDWIVERGQYIQKYRSNHATKTYFGNTNLKMKKMMTNPFNLCCLGRLDKAHNL